MCVCIYYMIILVSDIIFKNISMYTWNGNCDYFQL